MKNYPDWFASIDRTLVRRQDGTFVVVTDEELAVLRRENRLTTVMPKAMGGQVTDYTQKPVLMMRDE
jgi:hydrogenase maturation factor HypF (carbamoyltransferase family)